MCDLIKILEYDRSINIIELVSLASGRSSGSLGLVGSNGSGKSNVIGGSGGFGRFGWSCGSGTYGGFDVELHKQIRIQLLKIVYIYYQIQSDSNQTDPIIVLAQTCHVMVSFYRK